MSKGGSPHGLPRGVQPTDGDQGQALEDTRKKHTKDLVTLHLFPQCSAVKLEEKRTQKYSADFCYCRETLQTLAQRAVL